MNKKFKKIGLTGLFLAANLFTALGINATLTTAAYDGITSSLSEQELYNETNTFDADENLFIDGVFNPVIDENRITNTTQYPIAYDMTQRNENADNVMEETQITVLTHGLNSDAGTWSNQYTTIDSDEFAYDKDSLISRISDLVGGANVYWAKMNDYNSFDLCDITDQKSVGELYSNSSIVNNITDISKHIIIVFDCIETNSKDEVYAKDSNNNTYYQFNYMLSKIIYDVKTLNGGILPKVNLIGHSRGGLTNLQYALDHPDLVSTLVSLGTPYFGSTTARLFGEKFMGGASDGLDDILDAELYYSYNRRWNDNYDALYKNIDAYAFGSYHTLPSLVDVADNDLSDFIADTMAEFGLPFELVGAALGVVNVIKLLPDPSDSLVCTLLAEILNAFFPESAVVDVIELICKEINYDIYPLFVSWYSDVLVPLDSQLATGIGSVDYGGGSYAGFKRVVRPFIGGDADYTKISSDMPPVGHNLEARDSVLIKNILRVLDLGVSPAPYIIKDNGDGTVTFMGYNGSYEGEIFAIPETIDGKTVTAIAPFAFSDQNNILTVKIPSTVKRIGACAFAGLTNLKTVIVESGGELENISAGAFLNCTNLTQFGNTDGWIDIPSGVRTLGYTAFYGTKAETVYINSAMEDIGIGAFAAMKNLLNIYVADGSARYFSNDECLFDSNGWLMQYAIGNGTNSFSVPEQVNNVDIRFISQYAFAYAENLTSVSLNNIVSIDEYAFANCENLTSITSDENVEYIGASSFLNTPILNEFEGFLVIGKVLHRYNGETSVLTEEDFPSGITRISSYAFYENEYITTVYLPNSIKYIDNYAFAYCSELSEMRYRNTLLPDVNDEPFIGLPSYFEFYCRKSLIDNLTEGDDWYEYKDNFVPIKTAAYFETTVNGETTTKRTTFYYGEKVEFPDFEIAGMYIVGWRRVDKTTGEISEGYLSTAKWDEVIDSVYYQADLLEVETYTIYFKNGSNEDVSDLDAFHISTGDTFELGLDYIIINGVKSEFVHKDKMNNCAVDDYYGSRIINDIEIADFVGWVLDEQPIKSGIWLAQYSTPILYAYADWEPISFTATFDPNNGDSNIVLLFTYFSGITIPEVEKTDFRLKGWMDSRGIYYTDGDAVAGDISLKADWEELFKVVLISNQMKTYNATIIGTLGEIIELPTLTHSYYEVYDWSGFKAAESYKIVGNVILNANWGGLRLTINLYDSKSSLTLYSTVEMVGGETYTLNKFSSDTYNVFMGWYKLCEDTFSGSLPKKEYRYTYADGTSISPWTETSAIDLVAVYGGGTVTIASWYSRDSVYTITDAGRFYQSFDTVDLGDYCEYSLAELYGLGYKAIYLTVQLNIWEVNDGYQYIFIYSVDKNADGSETETLLTSIEIEHGGSTKDTSSKRYNFHFEVLLSENMSNTLRIRYGAAGNFEDDWKNQEIDVWVSAMVFDNVSEPSYTIM